MSSFGDNLFAKTLNATDIHSKGKIYWKDFVPPLENAGVSTLSSILSASEPDGDANNLPINNLGSLAMAGNVNMNTHNMVDTGTIGCITLDFDENAVGTTIQGSESPGDPTVCTHLDLSSVTNTFPPSINGNLTETLTLGNSAGGLDILNVGTLGCSAVSGNQVNAINSLLANAMGGRNINLNSDAFNDATLDFTGNPTLGQKTFIEGDDSLTNGVAAMTKCTYLDLSDSTNFIGASDDSRYEWGAVWNDAETHFPAPPYADGSTAQILKQDQVCFDFNQGDSTNGTSGWRYFAPQSDGACQIDGDDHMELLAGQYIWDQTGGTPWEYAFRAVTAPTTNPAHSTQIVEFTFPSNEYGFGRIYFSLGYSIFGSSTEPTPIGNCFFLNHEKEGSALGTNPRLNGTITVKWYVPNTFPTDGTRWNIFPLCRTDDSRTTKGHLLIRIGKGQPILDCNSANLPIFSPANSDAQTGQIIMRGYPLPTSFQEYPNYVP